MEERICKKCGQKFEPSIWNQVYCGSKTNKVGCSYWNININRTKRRLRNKKYKAFQRNYQKEWKKEQRRLNTDYAKKQRELKRRYYRSEKGKETVKKYREKYKKRHAELERIYYQENRDKILERIRLWRAQNKERVREWDRKKRERHLIKILERNRKRLFLKKGIMGYHSEDEWQEVKAKYKYKCAICGISENQLKKKWADKRFQILGRDHIIPISRGGADFICNIQPLCISCNSKKFNETKMKKSGTVKGKIVAVSGYWNPLHRGHIRLFEAAKELGEYLVVIVNNDEQVKLKGSAPFMNEKERMEIIAALAPVDNVILSIDKDRTVCKTLELIKPDVFANGGDRFKSNVPEVEICKKIGCKMVFNVGRGGKVQSSSALLRLFKEKSIIQ